MPDNSNSRWHASTEAKPSPGGPAAEYRGKRSPSCSSAGGDVAIGWRSHYGSCSVPGREEPSGGIPSGWSHTEAPPPVCHPTTAVGSTQLLIGCRHSIHSIP